MSAPVATTAGEPAQPPADGFAWRGLGEAAVVLAFLLAIDLLLGNADRFGGIEPHPFGLAVLLVACQYGAAEGAAAALLACAALFAFHWPEQAFGEDRLVWLGATLRQPLIWFTIALLAGGLAGRTRGRARLAEAHDAQRQGEIARVLDANAGLTRRVSALEARIAGQQRTITAVFEAARSVGPGRGAVLRGALALVRAAVGATQCAVYTLEAGRLQLAGADGWTDAAGPELAVAGGAFFEAIVGAQRSLVASRAEDRDALGSLGILAGPIVTEAGGVLGALVVQSLPLTQLHFGTVANFRAICAWIGAELEHAAEFDAAHDDGLGAGSSRLVAARHAERLLAIMSATARRLRFDLSLMQVDYSALDPVRHPDRGRVVVDVLETVFRNTDILLADEGGQTLRVLMPGTPLRDVAIVSARLAAALEAADPALPSQLAMSWLALNQARPEAVAA